MATKKQAPEYDPVDSYPPRSYEEAQDPHAFEEVSPTPGPIVPEGYSPPDPNAKPVVREDAEQPTSG